MSTLPLMHLRGKHAILHLVKGASRRTPALVARADAESRCFVVCGITGLAAGPARADTALPPGGHIAATIPDPATPVGVEAGFGSVWVANGPAGTIIRIDPATDTAVETIQAGRPVCCLAFGADAVWAASFVTDSVVRIDPAANAVADTPPAGGLRHRG